MAKPVVSITKYVDAYESVARAVDLCDGLENLRPNDRILLKPNLVEWDLELPFSPWGVVTTSAVMGALVRVLAERGFGDLTIGEGTPLPYLAGKGREVFGLLGYGALRDRYGVELVDFDEEPFDNVDLGDFKLAVARRALEADKIITVPTLKTHATCQVSLGIKNLKGCISRTSKRFCHHRTLDLDHTFPLLVEKLPVALNLIDGVFALERGPTQSGRAYRKDLLVASADVYAGDVVGAKLLGYDVDQVPHLHWHGERRGGAVGLETIDVRGERIEEQSTALPWDTPWLEDGSGPAAFDKLGISGLAFRKPDASLCTNCVAVMAPALVLLMTAHDREKAGTLEVLNGKKALASKGFDHTLLLGRCVSALNKNNPNINHAITLNTCPPDMETLVTELRALGLECDYDTYRQFRKKACGRYKAENGFDMGLYRPSAAAAVAG